MLPIYCKIPSIIRHPNFRNVINILKNAGLRQQNACLPLYLEKLLLISSTKFYGKTEVWGQIIKKSPSHGYTDTFRSRPYCISEIKIWFLDAMTTGTSYQKQHCWGSPFPNYTSKYLPNSRKQDYNLANTWKRQMTPLSREVTFSTNRMSCQRKRKIRTSKKRLSVSPSMHVLEGCCRVQKTWALVPILILVRKNWSLFPYLPNKGTGPVWLYGSAFWHQNALLLKLKNTGSWMDIFPREYTDGKQVTWRSVQHH